MVPKPHPRSLVSKQEKRVHNERNSQKRLLVYVLVSLFLLGLVLFFFWPIFSYSYYSNLYEKGKAEEKEYALNQLILLDHPRCLPIYTLILGDLWKDGSFQNTKTALLLANRIFQWDKENHFSHLQKYLKKGSLAKQKGVLGFLFIMAGQREKAKILDSEKRIWFLLRKFLVKGHPLRRETLRVFQKYIHHARFEDFLEAFHEVDGAFDFTETALQLFQISHLKKIQDKILSPDSQENKKGLYILERILNSQKSKLQGEEKQKWKNFIFQKLNSPDRMVVFYSLLILEYWAAKGDLENLKPFIHSSDEDFRDQMVSILDRIPGPLSQKYLFQLTMDSSRKIRDRAWMALGKKKVLEAISPLKEIVKNPKSPLRLDALEILCHYHHPSLISFFEEVLLDPQGEYRSLPFQGGYIMEKEFKFLALKGLEAFPNYPTSSIKQILVYPGSAKVRKKALEILWKREGTPKTAQIIENLRTHSSPTVRRYGKELCQVLQNLEKKKKKN